MELTRAELLARPKSRYFDILGKMPKTFWKWDSAKRIDWLEKNFNKRISGGVSRLVKPGSGGWKPETWGRNFREMLRAFYVGSAGSASRMPLTQADFGRLGALLKKQYEYARKFESQVAAMVASGKDLKEIEKYLLRRSEMYLAQGRAFAERMAIEQKGSEDDLLMWTLGVSDHCSDCLARDGFIAKRSELPWMPGDGQSQCFFWGDKVRVLTQERGSVRLPSVKVGEHVLSHTGKFRRVIGLTNFRADNCNAVILTIRFTQSGKSTRVAVTPDHLFLSDTWIRADAVVVGQRLGRMDWQHKLVMDAEVAGIERELMSGTVRCLGVEEDESFAVTHGLVSHNCLSNCTCEWALHQAATAGSLSALSLVKDLLTSGKSTVKDLGAVQFSYGDEIMASLGEIVDVGAVYSDEVQYLMAQMVKDLEAEYPGWFTNLDTFGFVAPKEPGLQVVSNVSMSANGYYVVPTNLADEYMLWCGRVADVSGKAVSEVVEQFPLQRFLFASGMSERLRYSEFILDYLDNIAEFKMLPNYVQVRRMAELQDGARALRQLSGKIGEGTVWQGIGSNPGERFGHVVWDVVHGKTDDFTNAVMELLGTSRAELETLFRLNQGARGFVDERLLTSLAGKLPSAESQLTAWAKLRMDSAARTVLSEDVLALSGGKVVSVKTAMMPDAWGLCSWGGDITLSSIGQYTNPQAWAKGFASYAGMDAAEQIRFVTGALDTFAHEYLHGLKFFDDIAVFGTAEGKIRAMRFLEELYVSSQAGPVTRQLLRDIGISDNVILRWFESAASDGYSWYIKEMRDIGLANGSTLAEIDRRLARLPLMMKNNLTLSSLTNESVQAQRAWYRASANLSIMQAALGDSIVVDGQRIMMNSRIAFDAMDAASRLNVGGVFDEFNPKKWYGPFVQWLRKKM